MAVHIEKFNSNIEVKDQSAASSNSDLEALVKKAMDRLKQSHSDAGSIREAMKIRPHARPISVMQWE